MEGPEGGDLGMKTGIDIILGERMDCLVNFLYRLQVKILNGCDLIYVDQ